MSNRKWKALKAERVLNELEKAVKDYNIDSVNFSDNLFFVDIKRVRDICQGMIDRKLNLKWYALGRPKQLADYPDELLDLMKRSGCMKILIGAESGSERVLEIIQKDSAVKDVFDVAKKFARHKIIIKFSMMIGIPGETEEEMWTTVKFAGDLVKIWNKHQINFFFYTPFPGSRLYSKALQMGFKEPKSLEGWGTVEFHESDLPWINKKKFEKLVNLYIPLCFLKPDFVSVQIKKSFRIPLYVAHVLAKARYKLNFYYFPFEWWLYKVFQKKIGVIY